MIDYTQLKGDYTKKDFNVGDMILYSYIEDEALRGRVIKLNDTTAEIEISFPGKKTEDVYTETFDADYCDMIPFSKAFKNFKTKSKKKSDTSKNQVERD